MPCVSGAFAFPRRWIQCLNSPYSGRGWTTANGLCPLGGEPSSVKMPKISGLSQKSRRPRSRHFLTCYILQASKRCWQMPSFSCFDFPSDDGVQSASAKFARRRAVTIMSCMLPRAVATVTTNTVRAAYRSETG